MSATHKWEWTPNHISYEQKCRQVIRPTIRDIFLHRLNMESDLLSLFGLHVYSSTHTVLAEPQTPLRSPRIWAHIRGRYWSASQDRRHLFVTPCFTLSDSFFRPLAGPINLSGLISRKSRDMQAMRDIPYLAANCNRSRQGRVLAG